ncbi:efflux RND transporter permease subunit [Massilia horti]|uniref:Efflux pump membrane transporter n=1 Tax=Massilia horti TaxID=2562153 RepID=A0A4Y9SZA2_9BURK|nr:efflux RND transporter permease subunit [Massilia horti]TFW31792.1 efflux RND transporter permease subunit [Massilia horti]
MARFFIDRPIFAIVIAILLCLSGILSILRMPIEQYPTIAPPAIQVTTNYPGASAETVETTVVQVIEQQMSGLDHLIYMASTSDDFGQGVTTLTFAPGANPDIAQVQVQNKLQLAIPQLPAEVQQTGIRVTKSSTSFLLVLAFVSTDNSMAAVDIANYLVSHVQDPLSRVDGVGNLTVFGTQYAMRIWLDPNKLNNFGLTPVDITNAVQSQNVQVASGQLGGTPHTSSQQFSATITEATLLRTPAQFGNILLKVLPGGSQVRLRDVARVALGGENYNLLTKFNDQPAAGLAVQLSPGANALATSNLVHAKVDSLARHFPPGLKVAYPIDQAPYIRASMEEVVKTLLEGIALVFLVMLLFLQNIRATLIPTIAVPVVLLGTFAIMNAAGFTINTLSLFGLVLAIGLLVDDAIVVVENVERLMTEEHLPPVEATRKAMGQISGALVGVATVLSAVFVPVAFSPGAVGAIYRQFSLTIVSAMLLSVFVALSLTPALCAMILKPSSVPQQDRKGFFGWFNRGFERGRDGYLHGVRRIIARLWRWMLVYLAVIGVVAFLFLRLPSAFLPDEDQGSMFVLVQTPPGATQDRTGKVLEDINHYLVTSEKAMVDSIFLVNGFSFTGRGQNQGMVFIRFRPFDQRTTSNLRVQALMARIGHRFAAYQDALIVPINPPPIRELGIASGFDFQLQDQSGVGHQRLLQARNQLLEMASHDPTLAQVRPFGLEDSPEFKVEIDREKAEALGVSPNMIDQSFSISWASSFINFFLDTDGRIKRVFAQADAPYRMVPEDLNSHFVRNANGAMVPFSSFATGRWTFGSPKLERYNGVSSFEIQGQAAPGRSTGQAITAMTKIAQQLPAGVGYDWTGISLQQIAAGAQAPLLYALSILVVFLSLAALYESWSIPLSVIMVVPIGVLGSLTAAWLSGMANDVYFQVGLLTTVGLSSKNAILIVEFARDLGAAGRTPTDAALEAAHIRLRPIVMTSLAFGLGVFPLAIARGAGAASQNAVGRGVIGGMVAATFLATFMIPMFYVLIASRLRRNAK